MPELTDVRVDRASFVDRAAVRDPYNKSEPRRFLLMKREGTSPKKGTQMAATKTASELFQQARNGDITWREAIKRMSKSDSEEIRKALGEGMDRFPNDGDVDRPEHSDTTESDMPDREGKDDPGHGKARRRRRPPTDDEEEQESEGAAKAELRKAELRMNSLQAEIRKAQEDAEKARGIAKAEVRKRQEAEWVRKAEAFEGLSANPRELGPALMRAKSELSKDDFKVLEATIEGASAVGADLFRMRGQEGGAKRPEGARAEVTRKAEKLLKADPDLGLGDAEARVLAGDPDLQRRHLEERSGIPTANRQLLAG